MMSVKAAALPAPSLTTPAVRRAHDMDEASFRNLYAATSRPLWAYLARVSGNSALADDLLQETYFRFIRAGAPLQEEVQARNYLFRIATNLLRDHFRRQRRSPGRPAPEADGGGPGDRIHLRHDLARVLSQLKPRQRQLLWLAHVEGFSHREIAALLGLREGSIRLLAFRARRRLAALLREKNLGPEVMP